MSEDSADPLYCAFCGKSQHEVTKLIAGATANICDECSLLCVDVLKSEHESDPRSVPCPGCGQRISMVAAVGRDQRWGMSLDPKSPGEMLQAATVAGAINGAQKMMRAACRENGANVQTYVERVETGESGSIHLHFVTLGTSKKWAEANGRAAQGMVPREDSRSEAEGVAHQPGPATQDAPNPNLNPDTSDSLGEVL